MLPVAKGAIVISPTSTTNAATTTGTLDTLGYDFAVIDVMSTTSNDTTNNFSVLKIEEGDTTSAYSAITALTGDGTGGFTIPAADTSTPVIVATFHIDLTGRKRHLKLSASPVTTQTIWAQAKLFRGDEIPSTATKANASVLVEV